MRHGWSFFGALATLALAACDTSSPLAPSPATQIARGDSLVIRGTVRETRPFPQVRVAGATLEACGAVAQTDAYGAFTLTTSRSCAFVSVRAPGYENAVMQIPDPPAELLDIELMPQAGEVEERWSGETGARFDLASQRGGAATVTLEWSDPDTDFDLYLWRGNKPEAYSTRIAGSTEQIHADLAPGVMYELAVFHYSGPDTPWSLTIRRPR